MAKARWWMRIVGGFYVLLASFNLVVLLGGDLSMLTDTLPYPASSDTIAAFADAWLVFVLEFLALGIVLLAASRRPDHNRILFPLIILAEVLRGIAADAIWIARGYSVTSYGAFIVLHLVIVLTGWAAWRGLPART